MQSNAVKKYTETRSENMAPASRDRAVSTARRIMARTRYQAPAVASYAISGCEQSGPLSMIGNG